MVLFIGGAALRKACWVLGKALWIPGSGLHKLDEGLSLRMTASFGISSSWMNGIPTTPAWPFTLHSLDERDSHNTTTTISPSSTQ